jgi:hypothetical protein
MKESDRRRHPRVKLAKAIAVAWRASGSGSVSRTFSVSLGGLFISTLQPQPAGTTLQVLFETPGGEVRARAVVRNVRPNAGMGIEFVAMQMQDRARLHHFIIHLPA